MKKIEVFNNQNGNMIDTWIFEDIITQFEPMLKAYAKQYTQGVITDELVLSFLEQRNSYCMFHITEE
jgi:hypothetical protein